MSCTKQWCWENRIICRVCCGCWWHKKCHRHDYFRFGMIGRNWVVSAWKTMFFSHFFLWLGSSIPLSSVSYAAAVSNAVTTPASGSVDDVKVCCDNHGLICCFYCHETWCFVDDFYIITVTTADVIIDAPKQTISSFLSHYTCTQWPSRWRDTIRDKEEENNGPAGDEALLGHTPEEDQSKRGAKDMMTLKSEGRTPAPVDRILVITIVYGGNFPLSDKHLKSSLSEHLL